MNLLKLKPPTRLSLWRELTLWDVLFAWIMPTIEERVEDSLEGIVPEEAVVEAAVDT